LIYTTLLKDINREEEIEQLYPLIGLRPEASLICTNLWDDPSKWLQLHSPQTSSFGNH